MPFSRDLAKKGHKTAFNKMTTRTEQETDVPFIPFMSYSPFNKLGVRQTGFDQLLFRAKSFRKYVNIVLYIINRLGYTLF